MNNDPFRTNRIGSLGRFIRELFRRRTVAHCDLVLLLVVILSWGFFAIGYMEKVPINDGFGWDGLVYGRFSLDFWEVVKHPNGLSPKPDRFLPSLMTYTALDVLGIEKTPKSVIASFHFLNLASLCLTAWFWWALFRHFNMETHTFWFGTTGLFVSHMLVKLAFWYPVLTDRIALALATAALYGVLTNRWLLAVVTAGISTVVWPTVAHATLLLLIWPHEWSPSTIRPVTRLRRNLASATIGLWLIAMTLGGALNVDLDTDPNLVERVLTCRAVWPISVGALAVFSTCAIAPFVRYFSRLRWFHLARNIAIVRVVLLLTIIIAVRIFTNSLSPRVEVGTRLDRLFYGGHSTIFFLGTLYPLGSLVAHTTYLGPIVLIAMLRYRAFVRSACDMGPSIAATVAALILMSATSETRHLTPFLPLFAFLVARTFDEVRLSTVQVFVFAVYSLWWTKIWLPFNFVPEPSARPFWSSLMHIGPRMPLDMYLLQGIAAIATLPLLYFALSLYRNHSKVQGSPVRLRSSTQAEQRWPLVRGFFGWPVHTVLLLALIATATWLYALRREAWQSLADKSTT